MNGVNAWINEWTNRFPSTEAKSQKMWDLDKDKQKNSNTKIQNKECSFSFLIAQDNGTDIESRNVGFTGHYLRNRSTLDIGVLGVSRYSLTYGTPSRSLVRSSCYTLYIYIFFFLTINTPQLKRLLRRVCGKLAEWTTLIRQTSRQGNDKI